MLVGIVGKAFVQISQNISLIFHSLVYIAKETIQLPNYAFCLAKNHLRSFTQIGYGDVT